MKVSLLNSTVVTVFLGIRLPGASLSDSALYPMVVYCVAVVIVIGFDIYLTFTKNRAGATFTVQGGGEKEG